MSEIVLSDLTTNNGKTQLDISSTQICNNLEIIQSTCTRSGLSNTEGAVNMLRVSMSWAHCKMQTIFSSIL